MLLYNIFILVLGCGLLYVVVGIDVEDKKLILIFGVKRGGNFWRRVIFDCDWYW